MSGQIFINYRRDDDPGFTALLREHLAEKFAADQLFMDIDSIEPGLDFVRVLEEKVDKCDVFLAVIGPRWLDSRDEAGNRRLDNPTDFVRIEIESCLKLEKRIIPVLVNNADIPRPEHLPVSLKPLARRNAVRLTRDRFKADAQGLIKALEKALEEVEANRLAATTAAAVKAKGQEQESKAEEIERQEKEQARLHAIAGLSPEQIAKAEELANWDFIKESKSAQDFRDQLARFPKGVTERMARAKLEAIVWEELGELPQIEALDGFLTEFPDGTHATEARARLNEQRNSESQRVAELAAWNAVKETTDAKTLQAFLQEWPNSAHAAEGRRLSRQTSPPLKGGGRSPRKILKVAAGAAVIGLPVALLTFQAYYAPDTDHNNDARLERQSQPVYPSESDNNSTTYTGLARQAQSLNPSSPPKTVLNTDTGLAKQPQPVYPSESDNNSTTYTGLARQAQSLNPSSPPKTVLNTDTGLAKQPQPVYPSESDNNSTTYTGLARQAQSLNPSSPPKTVLNTDTGLARQPQPVYPSESDNNSTTYTGLARQAQSLNPSSPPKTALNTDTAAYNVDTGLAQQPQPVDPTSPSKSDYPSQPSSGTTSRVIAVEPAQGGNAALAETPASSPAPPANAAPPADATKVAAAESKDTTGTAPEEAKTTEAPLPPAATRRELAQDMLAELKRLGCYFGSINGNWGTPSQLALDRFNRLASLELPLGEPQQASLDALKGWKGPHCPIEQAVPPRLKQRPVVVVPRTQAVPPRKAVRASPPSESAIPRKQAVPPRKAVRASPPKAPPVQAVRPRPKPQDHGSDEINELKRAFPSTAWPE